MSLSLFSWLLALSAIVTLSLSLFALSRRVVAGALPFALTLFGEFIWCGGYWWELHALDLGGKLFWDNVQFLGTDIGVAGGMLFALAYTGRQAWLRRSGWLLAIFPVISLLIIWGAPGGLVRSAPKIVAAGGQLFLAYTYGPWFWAIVGYSYLLILTALATLVAFAAQSHSHRQPTLAFMAGFSAPAIGSLLTVCGLIPISGLERLDISPLSFTFTIPLMTWALFRKHLLDLVPIARTLLVEQMRDAVLVLDVQRRVVDINPQAIQLLQWSQNAVIGEPIGRLLPALDRLITSVGKGGPADLDIAQQPLRDVEVAITSLRGRGDRQIGWLVVLRDITAQRQQSRYQRALASCSQILLRTGHQPAETERALSQVLGVLRRAARVRRIDLYRSGLNEDGELQIWPVAQDRSSEAAPFPLDECLSGGRLPAARAELERDQILSGPAAQLFGPDMVRALADGGVRSLLIMPLAGAEGWWGILYASTDRPDHPWDTPTSEFLHAAADMVAVSMQQWEASEALVQAKDAAEAANRAKSSFLSMMSHELRTPLTAIIGYSQLMDHQVASGDYRNVVTDLRHIYTAGQHLLALINGLLDLSRVEAGNLAIDVGPVDIADLVYAIAATVRPLVSQNRNVLQVICADGMAIMYTDATRVRQVLLNLLNNAAKFTNAGTITLGVRQEQVGGKPWAVFNVADTGIGIDVHQMHRLFQPFSQLDDSLNRRYGGSGLGLALSRRLCQLLGGDISVESQLGAGTVFTVRLPMRFEAVAQK